MDDAQYFRDYYWKNGIPYGKELCNKEFDETYKIVSDPYRKRISIEKYFKGQFSRVIYDSVFLNFKLLKSTESMAWEKTVISETANSMVCLIRDQDDRLLFQEKYRFEGDFCRECIIESSHGYLLSVTRMLYKNLGDKMNGVILYDPNERPIMFKQYEVDKETGKFTTLLEEHWNVRESKYEI